MAIFISMAFSCKENADQKNINSQGAEAQVVQMTRMVSTKSGLNLRNAPDSSAYKILTIPYRAKVFVVRKKISPVIIDEVSGHWAYVRYSENSAENTKMNQGWVFDAYLEDLKVSDCISLEDLDSHKIFYVNFPGVMGTSYYRDRFDFHSDKSGILHRAVESRGTVEAGEFPFQWKKKDTELELRFDNLTNHSICPECTKYDYDGPNTDLKKWAEEGEQCRKSCEQRYLNKYGKLKATFQVVMHIKAKDKNEADTKYEEIELDRREGKLPWEVKFLYSNWEKVIDINQNITNDQKVRFSCFTEEKMGS